MYVKHTEGYRGAGDTTEQNRFYLPNELTNNNEKKNI